MYDYNNNWETPAIMACAAYNFLILFYSKLFTNTALFEADPLFSRDGCILVVVWGLMYLSLAWDFRAVPWAFGVFFLEKMFYVQHYVVHSALGGIHKDTDCNITRSFLQLYGIGDLVSAIFFLYIWVQYALID
eukprot:CAMPEP_0182927892 /NCGR_PEP_ID=MMETSP0105_2-20130417/14595_1 /TAXON_ID=81532 ORGANISM="Acanthoeca-like sp., Strain 10tr" /NCGR_SAMPLE_ID=MMETSP0105_2 /ASSEMBLY_ACC=CAM_ASM_000205 /LENGTH=132 /DNA_ID=CAMNT_0025065869 /DNA_START=154 /DNA_END=552 /DNA_ORIENTATION=-